MFVQGDWWDRLCQRSCMFRWSSSRFIDCIHLYASLTEYRSPWYNHTSWLGVKHQLTYLLNTDNSFLTDCQLCNFTYIRVTDSRMVIMHIAQYVWMHCSEVHKEWRFQCYNFRIHHSFEGKQFVYRIFPFSFQRTEIILYRKKRKKEWKLTKLCLHIQILPFVILHPKICLFIIESFYNKYFLAPSPSTHHPWCTLTMYSSCHYLVCTGLLCMVTGPLMICVNTYLVSEKSRRDRPKSPFHCWCGGKCMLRFTIIAAGCGCLPLSLSLYQLTSPPLPFVLFGKYFFEVV